MATIEQLTNVFKDDLGSKQCINGSIAMKSQLVNFKVSAATFLTYVNNLMHGH